MEVVGFAMDETVDLWRNPYASLRWHYPDQVQRVFLTHAAQTSHYCATQDPRVSRAHDTPAARCLATGLENGAARYAALSRPVGLISIGVRGLMRRSTDATALTA
jgi:hypothetical protein